MYDEFTLPNGLRIIGEKIPHFRSISVGLWVEAGSLHEKESENGLTHFLEHMLFKGTERRTAKQIAQEMDGIGGQINAFTSKECTCYYARVLDEHLDTAIDILCDLLMNSVIDETELEKEKGVIIEEISMVEDSPEDLVHELLGEAHFGEHPLSRTILGPVSNIERFKREDLIKYREENYIPDKTVLSIAGNYDFDKVVELAQKYLSGYKKSEGAKRETTELCFNPSVLKKEKKAEQLHICLGFPGIGQECDDIYPLSVFNNIFGGGMSSRLFQKIREEEGMAYSVYTYPSAYIGCGMYAVYAGLNPKNADRVLELISGEIADLRKNGISEAEFSQAREQLKGGYVLGLESTSSRMSSIGRSKLLLNRSLSEADVLEKIRKINRDDCIRVMNGLFDKGYSAAFVGNIKKDIDLSHLLQNM